MVCVCCRNNAFSDWLILGNYSSVMSTGRLLAKRVKSLGKSEFKENILLDSISVIGNFCVGLLRIFTRCIYLLAFWARQNAAQLLKILSNTTNKYLNLGDIEKNTSLLPTRFGV